MDWFGEDWGAPITEGGIRVETPVGVPCVLCKEPIALGDRGIMIRWGLYGSRPIHVECELREIVGGIEHLTASEGHAVGSCYAGSKLTYRQSAVAAWKWLHGSREVGHG